MPSAAKAASTYTLNSALGNGAVLRMRRLLCEEAFDAVKCDPKRLNSAAENVADPRIEQETTRNPQRYGNSFRGEKPRLVSSPCSRSTDDLQTQIISFDRYGTLINFETGTTAKVLFKDRVPADRMPAFLDSLSESQDPRPSEFGCTRTPTTKNPRRWMCGLHGTARAVAGRGVCQPSTSRAAWTMGRAHGGVAASAAWSLG